MLRKNETSDTKTRGSTKHLLGFKRENGKCFWPLPSLHHRNITWFSRVGKKPTNCRCFITAVKLNEEKAHSSEAGASTGRSHTVPPDINYTHHRRLLHGKGRPMMGPNMNDRHCVSHEKPTPSNPLWTTLNSLIFRVDLRSKRSFPTFSFFSPKWHSSSSSVGLAYPWFLLYPACFKL